MISIGFNFYKNKGGLISRKNETVCGKMGQSMGPLENLKRTGKKFKDG
jgi:hypothetical protein